MALVIYAVKVGVPKEKVEEDSYNLLPFMNSLTNEQEFTKDDIKSALELYDERYCTFPISDISKITDIEIKKNKRNYRKQAEHIKLMNFIRDEINQNKHWQGRKSKRDLVISWRRDNPNKTISECARALNISRTTVYKYWDEERS